MSKKSGNISGRVAGRPVADGKVISKLPEKDQIVSDSFLSGKVSSENSPRNITEELLDNIMDEMDKKTIDNKNKLTNPAPKAPVKQPVKNAAPKPVPFKKEELNAEKLEEVKVESEKRRVGRPRKNKTNKLVFIKGIVNEPKDSANIMELACHDPSIFKKIFCMLKSYSVNDIEFVFTADKIELASNDFLGVSQIFTVFDASKMYHYYANKKYTNQKGVAEIRIGVSRNDMDELFNSIDKTYDRVSFWIEEKNINSSINISLHHEPTDCDQNFNIQVKQFAVNVFRPVYDDNVDYPLRFTLSTKSFKQIIERINKIFSTFSIKKEGHDSPLIMEEREEQGKSIEMVFNNNDKIGIVDRTSPTDIICVEMNTEYIILLSKTTMGDYVKISVDNNKKILFQMALNDICFIDVFTQIKGI